MKLKSIAAAAGLLTAATIHVQAAEVELRLSHWVAANHPIQELGIQPWVDSIHEASQGRINITIFPGQQLGSATDHYDMARDGIVDISYTNPGYQAGRFPIYSLAEIPFHASDAVRGAMALHEWYEPIAETEMSDVYFCVINPHDPGTLHTKTEVRVPEDIRGMSIRPAHATMARFISSLGANAIQVPAPEARDAIARGVADGITFPWNSIFIFGIDSETKHHLDMPFYLSAQMLLFNRGTIDGLSEENRQVIEDHCTPEWSSRISEGWAANERSGRQKMIDAGDHVLYEPTEEEVQRWRDAAAPLVDAWRSDVAAVGGDPDALYQGYLDALERHDARY